MKIKRLAAFMLTLLTVFTSLVAFADITDSTAEEEVPEAGFYYDFEHTTPSISLVNLDSGITVYSENSNVKRPVGSLAKIMTYIVAYENIPDIENTKITIDQYITDRLLALTSTTPIVVTGEDVSVLDLLHLLMIPTGNDAALVLQHYIDSLYSQSESGSYFVDIMNKKAEELGCTDTNFVDPMGLDDNNNYSTSSDMAKIAVYASTLPYFSEIVSKTYYTIPANDYCYYDRTVYTTNYMLTHANDDASYYVYATGMKAGSSEKAGYCVAASASYGGYSYVCIALGAPMYDTDGSYISQNGAMADAANMFRWAFTQVSLKIIANEGDLLGDVDVLYSWDESNLQLVAGETIYTLLPESVSVSSLRAVIDVPDSVEAPIKKGDKIGKISFYYGEQLITTSDLIASKSISRSEVIHTVETGKKIINSGWFKAIFSAVIILLAVYFIIIYRTNKKKKKMKRLKKRRNL